MKVFSVLKYILGAAVSVLLLALLLVAVLDWNMMRAPVSRWVSEATGRPFVIKGDLSVSLGLRPRIVANDLVLGNAAWSGKPNMLEIKQVDLRLDVFRLLTTGLAFSEIALSAPQVVLEVSPDGKPNWVFNDQKARQAVVFPVIDALTIDHGSVTYRDPGQSTDLCWSSGPAKATAAMLRFPWKLTEKAATRACRQHCMREGGHCSVCVVPRTPIQSGQMEFWARPG